MAKATGLSHVTIARIWRAFGLQPHRTETFTLSPDPLLIEKVRDIVGLYLNPPDHALVLCVDEKSQIQVLDRTQPLLPMQPGQAARQTHTYRRHGTTSLFAALDARSGRVIGHLYRRPVDACVKAQHREEIKQFAATVAGDETLFLPCSYRRLLDAWTNSKNGDIRAHAVDSRFSP